MFNVNVKQLVWEEGPNGSHMLVAKAGEFGEYWVWGGENITFDPKPEPWGCWSRGKLPGNHAGSIEAAKKAAQDDFIKRVMTTLDVNWEEMNWRPVSTIPIEMTYQGSYDIVLLGKFFNGEWVARSLPANQRDMWTHWMPLPGPPEKSRYLSD